VRFQELTVGKTIELGPREVSEAEIIEFALRYDPQPFHTNRESAMADRWGGLIASGWMTCSIAMELVVRGILLESESYGSPGVEKVEWLHPVRPGDSLWIRVTVLESRISSSKRIGIIVWQWDLFNQLDVQVFRMRGTSFFAL
jgi:acyl dehydratase